MPVGIYEALVLNQAPGWAEETQCTILVHVHEERGLLGGAKASICSAVTQVLGKEEGGHLTWLSGRYHERQPRGGDLSMKSSGMSKDEAGHAWRELAQNGEWVHS